MLLLPRSLSTFAVALAVCASIAAAREPENFVALSQSANDVLGLRASRVVELDVAASPGQSFSLSVPLDGRQVTLDLAPHSVRSADHYRVMVQQADGKLVEAKTGPVRTLRGAVQGQPGSVVAGSLLKDGLYALVQLTPDAEYWIEPLFRRVDGASRRHYVLYRKADVLPGGHSCATEARQAAVGIPQQPQELGGCGGGGVCVAELACDADVEYFNTYGTVPATEARINAVINTVNLQYESQVGITHQITTIIVRTANPDPYTSTDAVTRLCEFITEWTNNQSGVQRDMAQLFTGAVIDGTTIGIAADIGGSGVCVNSGACTGGPFGPLGSYCLSQSDFNGNFSCATDLSAHEMGHLWGAFHCSCPSNTMNAGITCTNTFTAGSISSIVSYRDTRACLTSGVGCTKDCQPGHIPEAEPICVMNYDDVTNGGCNSTVPTWSPIGLSAGVCGESGTYLRDIPCVDDTPCTPFGQTCNTGTGICNGGPFGSRDTDWWQFTLTEAHEVNLCVTGEFPVLVGIVDDGGGANCAGAAFLSSNSGFGCVEVCATADLTAGTWTAFVSPNTFDSVACGSTYNAEVRCDSANGTPTTYQATVNQGIPDGSPGTPLTHTINVPDSVTIGDLDIALVITHTWVGDLTVTLEHLGTSVSLISRPGLPDIDPSFGCSGDDYNIVLDDGGTGGPIEDLCAATLPPSPPNYSPDKTLSAFDGMDSAGDWTITIADSAMPDPGTLVEWSLLIDSQVANPCTQNLCAGVDCTALDNDCAAGVCDPANGLCVQDTASFAGVECRASTGQCDTAETCDGLNATCPTDQFATGPCDDGNACTLTDTCQAGVCTGSNPVVCTPLDQCHVAGTCDTGTGLCDDPFAANGTSCNDNNACTQTDICQAGICTGGNPVICTPLDQCHVAGTCDTVTGLCDDPFAPNGTGCDDSDACTQTDTCQVGVCAGSNPVICTPLDQCHVAGTCDTVTGLCDDPFAANGTGCNDNNACTQTDACQTGVCVGSNPITCTPLDQCHVAGTCDTVTGLCDDPFAPNGTGCNDNNACTQTDACQAGICTGSNPVICTPLDQCHVAGACDTVTGLCDDPFAANGTGCDDSDACTQTDTCQAGVCAGSNPVICTPLDQCHVAGTCDTVTGLCDDPFAPNGTGCNDNNACTQTDECQTGVCTGSNSVVCTPLDQCHATGTCDTITGLCDDPFVPNGTGCDDSDACTQTDECQAGQCTGNNTIICTPLDQCHVAGTCDTVTGLCDDPFAPDGTGCDDGDLCTQNATCTGGSCGGGTPVSCPPDQLCDPGDGQCKECLLDTDCATNEMCDIKLGTCFGLCVNSDECADLIDNLTGMPPADAVRDNACLWWSCGGGTCSNDPAQPCDIDGDCGAGNSCTPGVANTCTSFALIEPSDMGSPFNNCEPDGFCNNSDVNHALLCFAASSPCEKINIDAGGPFSDCNPDGFCNLFDANHALACFANQSPCDCSGGPAPQIGSNTVAQVTLTARASVRTVQPGQVFQVNVFIDGSLDALQSYQLHTAVTGGSRGRFDLVDVSIEDRGDHVFAGQASQFDAFNIGTSQMIGAMYGGFVDTPRNAYLATFTYEASTDASGTFVIDVLHDETVGDQTFLIGANYRDRIEVTQTKPAIVFINPGTTEAIRR